MSEWIEVCATDCIDEEDVIRWDHDSRSFAIYHTKKGFFATAAYCTHQQADLEDGVVIGAVIECPLHQGRFDIATGKALRAPVRIDLATFPVKVEGGIVFINI
ncbi:MAG: non-heme iron oxygenase ferredoxin subunit [Halieaceae bacterium]|nr:non-heme iron oxygenase ferredoxin subunit [Halieaceae bacterium]